MANVPNYGGPQATPTTFGYQPFSTNIPKMPESGINDSIKKASKAADEIYTKFLDEQDDARVTSALTDMRKKAIDMESGEDGWGNLLGENALAADDEGMGLVDRADKGLRSYGDELRSRMTIRQQKKFDTAVESIYQSNYASTSQHVFKQSQEYRKAALSADVAQFVEAGSTYAGKPDMLQQSELGIRDGVAKLGEMLGYSPEMTDQLGKKEISQMYMNAIEARLAGSDKDPRYAYLALGILQANSHKMLGSDVAKARRAINPVLELQRKYDMVDGFVKEGQDDVIARESGYVGVVEAGGGKREDITVATSYRYGVLETVSEGGLQSKITKPNEEDKATWQYGSSQLTIDQARKAAEDNGLKFDEKAFMSDRGYNNRLGMLHYESLISEFAGDQDKAMAGYLGSADTVRQAEKDAEESGKDWTEHLPKALAQKVADSHKNLQMLSHVTDENGKPMSPLDPAYAAKSRTWQTAEEAQKWFEAHDRRAAVDAAYCDELVTMAMTKVKRLKADYTSQQNDAKAQAMELLWQNNGDWTKVPLDLQKQLDVETIVALKKKAKDIEMGSLASNPMTLGRLSDDATLAGMTLTQVRLNCADLNANDTRAVMKRWALLKEKQRDFEDQRGHEKRAAEIGIISSDYVPKSAEVESALSTQQWYVDLKKEDPATANSYRWEVMREIGRQSQLRGYKTEGVDVYQAVMEASLNLAPVNGFWGDTQKNVWTISLSDLPNVGNTDARNLIKRVTQLYVQSEGHDRTEVTEAEMNTVLRRIFIRKDGLPFVIPNEAFNEAVMNRVREEFRAKHPGKEMTQLQELQGYLLYRAANKEFSYDTHDGFKIGDTVYNSY